MGDNIPSCMASTEWKNYGDANPEAHGGNFIKWVPDQGMWKIVKAQGGSAGVYWAEPMDYFKDGDYLKGFTEETQRDLDSFWGVPFDVDGIMNPPDGHTTAEAMEHVANQGDLEWFLGTIAIYHEYGHRHYQDKKLDDYWNDLEEYFGITPEANE